MTLEERIAFLEGLVAGMGSRLDAFEQWKRGLVGVVEPVERARHRRRASPREGEAMTLIDLPVPARLAAFYKRCFESWVDSNCLAFLDGADFQEWSHEAGLMVAVPYDPAKHHGIEDAEPGDSIYVLASDVRAYLYPQEKEGTVPIKLGGVIPC